MSYRGGRYNNGYAYPPSSSQDNGYYPKNQQQRYNQKNTGYPPQEGYYPNGYPVDYNASGYDQGYNNGYNAGYGGDYYANANGYQSNQQQQAYYKAPAGGYYKYPKQKYPKSAPSFANQYQIKNEPSSQYSNTATAPEMVEDTVIYEPIVKSYALNGGKQGNFVSQIQEVLNGIDSHQKPHKSFKTVHIKTEDIKMKSTLEIVDPLSNTVIDARIDNPVNYLKYLSKSNSKPVTKLYIPVYKYDKYSIGEKPCNEILVWNLHSTTTSMAIRNNFSTYGPITEVKMIDDPETAVPMGMCLLSFDGKAEQAHNIALKAVEMANKKLLIQGRYIRCGLNEKNQVYMEIYKKTMDVRDEKVRKQKIEDAKKEEQLKQEKIRKEKLEKEQERLKTLNAKQANANSQIPLNNTNSSTSVAVPAMANPNSLTIHDRHIYPVSACNLSFKFQKYISNRPFIFIDDKYVPSMQVSSEQIKRMFVRYHVIRVLQQRNGFYLVFNKLHDAMNCFDKEDGNTYMSYKVYMSLYVPDKQINETRVGQTGGLKLAQKQVMKELNAYLFKDIREKVIGGMIMDILNTDEMAKVAEESRKKRDEERKLIKEEESKKLDTIKIKKENTVRVFKGLDLNVVKKSVKKSFIPMSHSLNKTHDHTDEDSDDTESEESEESEAEDEVGEVIPEVVKPVKKRKSEPAPKVFKKKTKIIEPPEIDIIEDDEEDEDMDVDREETDDIKMETEQSDITPPSEPETKSLVTKLIDNVFQPSTALPSPVFNDTFGFIPTLEFLKSSIKTKQDFQILSSLCKDVKFEKPIKDVKFWAWEHVEAMKENDRLGEEKEEDGEDIEEFDYEDEVLHNKELRNTSGCFKTEGYHKIPDKLKREYLLHRRKLTNLNPVKHEDDDEANITNHNNFQSSRVNRANTRRFVADISAQKQIIGETDLLDLNQLNKRKKPVQFARSAIHNWGLYALEPISAGEMIIEYVGERIRQQVAEVREKKYLRSGIGSSYLFRIDENTVIDASKRGGIARFINHCCEPSCTAKIIKVGGKKRIVIYALRDVKRNEELTYDYKFERETNDEERIPCLCGAPGCKGYLN